MPDYLRVIPNPDLTFHAPQHVYECKLEAGCPIYSRAATDQRVICQLTSNTNESQLWCEACGEQGEWTPLRKSFQAQGTFFAQVWQDTDTPNLTTGRVETDQRKMATYLRDRSDQESERLGMKVDMQIVDPTDRDALGVTDEGLDATHDHAVRTGQKDSRGRFVWGG